MYKKRKCFVIKLDRLVYALLKQYSFLLDCNLKIYYSLGNEANR